MKGIILAGGTGSRLFPLTLGVNKHLLPVGKQPMIGHAFALFDKLHIDSVLIVTTPEDMAGYGRLISCGEPPYNRFITYLAVQKDPRGIADAIKYGYPFVDDGESVLVMLADNIFSAEDQPIIARDIESFEANQGSGAHVWVTETEDPSSMGVLVLEDDKPVSIVEKPEKPISNLGVTGLYLFDHNVWLRINRLQPSARGEYEVTDLLYTYLQRDQLHYTRLVGEWFDLGQSVPQFLEATDKIRSQSNLE